MNALCPAPVTEEPQDGQFELIADDEDLRRSEQLRGGRHTAGRIRHNDPKTYGILVEALRGAASITGLARAHRIGVNTLYAIIDAEWGSRDAYHKELASGFKTVANLCKDRLLELVPDCKSVAELSMAAGVATDKALALSGGPQLAVLPPATEDGTAKLGGMIEQMRSRLAERKITGRVVEPENHKEGTAAA